MQRLVKILAVVILLVAAATAILGFFPGHRDATLGIQRAGGSHALLLAILALPAIAVLVHPTPRVLMGWSVIAWIAAFVDAASQCKCDYRIIETYLPGRLVEIGTRVLIHMTCLVVPMCVWLVAAARRTPAEDDLLARRIRIAARLFVVLAAAMAVLIVPSDLVHRTRFYIVELLVLLAVPAVLLHREPTRRNAGCWMIWAMPILGLLLIEAIGLAELYDGSTRIEAMMLPAAAALGTLLYAVIPIVFFTTREASDSLPRATDRSRNR